MPISLLNKSTSSEETFILDKIEFVDSPEFKYFRISDNKGHEIRIPHVPPHVTNWKPEWFKIFLFENPYLSAENDVFELYETTIEQRFGWIFPIATLDSNENDFVKYKNFKEYRSVSYAKLLELDLEIPFTDAKQEYNISEILPNLCVGILSVSEIQKIPDFKFENYLLSFLKYDYLLFSEKHKAIPVFNKTHRIQELRAGNHSIKIKKAGFEIQQNPYTKSLFIEHLYQSESILVRYIFLYQILEHFMEEESEVILDSLIHNYQKKNLNKNQLREKISKYSSERSLIKKVFERSNIDGKLKTVFIDQCRFLFNDIHTHFDENFEDAIYDLRNLITHRYRSLTHKISELTELTKLFEEIVLDLLISRELKGSVDKVDDERKGIVSKA